MLSMHKQILSYVLILLLVSLIIPGGCSKQDDTRDMPNILRIGILPDEGKKVLLQRYTPLFKYLANELKISYELILPSDYADLLVKFEKKEIDIAYFGGFTFIQAHNQSNAVPLVMRDIDIHFTSYFFVKSGLQSNKIEDFKSASISFGSRLSTSGHLMPRYFLNQQNIIPETYFGEVMYSGSHDKTAYWVRDGRVDVGAANSKIIDKMLLDGRIKKDEINIIQETPPYTDYVWAIQPGYSQSVQTKIRNTFLSLTPANKKHAAILENIDASGFLPASYENFSKLDEVARQSGLLE